MSNRIDSRMEALAAEGRCALIPFITTGDPHPDWTVDIMHALVEGGADLIELGVPFSDPTADGPVIQQSSERAIEEGVSLQSVLDTVSAFRQADQETPVVLMGYMNPLERYGHEAFAKEAGQPLQLLFNLATLLPTLAVTIRRLHDTDHSGWWILLGLIPVIGTLILLWWYIQRGTEGENNYGPEVSV